jgi:diguanylate cyclase (GGDEF)-like protein/PAS domain S-box-containing protein
VLLLSATVATGIVVPAIAGGLRAAMTVGGAVVAVVNASYAARAIHAALGRRLRLAPGGTCRSAGLLGMGLMVSALVGVVVAMRSVTAQPADATAELAFGGLIAAAIVYLPGMLLLPGTAHSTVARLRRGFDGLSVGICLLFSVWVLLITPRGTLGDLGFWVALLASCVLSVAVVTGLRGRASAAAANCGTGAQHPTSHSGSQHCGSSRPGSSSPGISRLVTTLSGGPPSAGLRPAGLACTGGVALSVVGLGGLALISDQSTMPFVACAVALVTAPVVLWRGVRLTEVSEEPRPADGLATLAGYPVLAVPAAAAIVVALHRLFTGGEFDRPSVILAIGGVAAIALRETFSARDASRYARRLVEQEAQFRNLVAGSTDVIMVLDADLIVRWQSPASARLFGLSDQEVVGRHFQSMVHPEDAVIVADRLAEVAAGPGAGLDGDRPALVEGRVRDGFGQWRETESSLTDQRHVPAVSGLVVHIRDISERKEMERALHRLTYADQLTGLANRRQMIMSMIALRSLPRARGALLLLELDGFNAVNDVRGFDIGDAVLVEVARRMRAGAAETDVPARLSGDEFAVVTEATPVQAYALATRLLTMLAEPIILPGVTVHLTASIGMTDLGGGSTCDEVLRRADLALRRAKQLGRGRVEWYDEAVEQALLRRMTLEMELPDAMVRGELDVIYQPILDLAGPRPVAVEALLRWRHPRLGTLLPADVIPVAEDLGLITEIGSWVLYRATRQLASWRREGRQLWMAVNVSPDQLAGPELIDDVAAALELNGLPAGSLVLELAEGGLADVCDLDERVGKLRSCGVRTALDEFGAGPASLSHLRRLPIDMVKLGRSYFDEVTTPGHPSLPIIDAMVMLGRRLGIDVVAHGVEEPAHLEVVRAAGCRLGQGHLFAHPQPVERTEAYLDGFRAPSR